MAQQPNLFPPNPNDNPGARATGSGPTGVGPQRVHWMARIEAIIRILVTLYLGLLVLVLPWLAFWSQNNLWTYSPMLQVLGGSGFFRGAVSGLGLLNIVAAVLDARSARELA